MLMNTSSSFAKKHVCDMLTNLLSLPMISNNVQMSTDHTPPVLVRLKDMKRQSTVAHANLMTVVQVIGSNSTRVRS